MEKARFQVVAQKISAKYVTVRHFVQWAYEDGTVRKPEESTAEFAYPGPFTAAGKTYTSWQQLCALTDKDGRFCRDIYGRDVFCRERFPCFDSYDYLHENRYYRWFFLRDGDKLTRVDYTDERRKITVTEDVQLLSETCWKQMQEYGFCP